MKPIFELLKRVVSGYAKDLGSIFNEAYNEPSGAIKQIIVEPVVRRPVTASDLIPFGSYVKVTGTTYQLRLLGKAYNPLKVYRKNEMVTQGGRVYIAEEDGITGTFDASKWNDVAPDIIGPITIQAGSVVCCGRFHNNVNAAGFLIDDDSEIKKSEM
jgi:hypothetical protein